MGCVKRCVPLTVPSEVIKRKVADLGYVLQQTAADYYYGKDSWEGGKLAECANGSGFVTSDRHQVSRKTVQTSPGYN